MKYIHEEIYNLIPNRYPLMFLDSLDVEDNSAVANIALKDDTWFFACHYPGFPIMPLSLLLECMTQTFSATFLSRTPPPRVSRDSSYILNQWGTAFEGQSYSRR